MDERSARQIFHDLDQYYQNEPADEQQLEDRYTQVLEDLTSVFLLYEEKRAANFDNFKNKLMAAIEKNNEQRIRPQLDLIAMLAQKSRQEWALVKPRMEALAQIRTIFKHSFGRK